MNLNDDGFFGWFRGHFARDCGASYLRNINTEPHSMNYELANSFHKVGIVSLGIYPLISISDILSCYIKCKSDGIQLAGKKRIQRLVNKEINDNRRKNIYLCRD